MAYVTYEARRGLVGYHASGTSYVVDFDITSLKSPNGSDLKVKTKSLSGQIETLYFGEERIWQVTIAPIQANSPLAGLLFEFLRSTADGQQFVFDPYGRNDNDVQPMAVIREDDGYTRETFQEIDGVSDYIKLGFSVREV